MCVERFAHARSANAHNYCAKGARPQEGAQRGRQQGPEGEHNVGAPLIPRVYRRKAQPFALYMLQPLCLCGCGAIVFPEEGTLCCKLASATFP